MRAFPIHNTHLFPKACVPICRTTGNEQGNSVGLEEQFRRPMEIQNYDKA